MTVRAAFDIGSNSVKVVAAERLDAPRLDAVTVCGLGESLPATGRLSEPAMERTLDALADLVRRARAAGASDFAAVGTQSLRRASNAAEFLRRAEARCGLAVEIIPGEEEARLSFLAARSGAGAPEGPCLLFDVGGGSTEFIRGEGDALGARLSLELGCLHLREAHERSDPIRPDQLAAMQRAAADALAPLGREPATLVGIGGTVTSLGTVALGTDWDPARLEGMALSRAQVEAQLERFASLRVEARAALPGLLPARAPVILAGAAIVLAILRHLDAPGLRLSARALRHGLWLDRWGGARG